MRYLLTFFCVICIYTCKVLGQDTVKTNTVVKTNPIVFGEGYVGGAVAGQKGFQFGASLNYQFKQNLITFRLSEIDRLKGEAIFLTPVTVLPIITDISIIDEYAFLYGWRLIKNGSSLSLSLGISENKRTEKYRDQNYQKQEVGQSYIGLPFELNAKIFKKEKKRYRIYYIIPVGKPTGYGGSFGLKLSGNFSKYSYLAFGIVGGLGYHKHY